MGSKTAAELVIDVVTNAERGVDGLDDVADSADRATRAVTDVGDTAERAGRQIGVSADQADALASKSSQATGALGALSAGFELVGADKYAGALQSAAMATDFMSGVGDSLNLVMESQAVKTALAKVQMVGHAIASGASATATGVMTAAQWALNAAMSANPIALVVLALVALVAGLVLAYRKSETVRDIVQTVGRVGREAVGWVVDKVGELVGWLGDQLPGGLNTAKRIAVAAFDTITAGPRTLVDLVSSAVGYLRKTLPDAFDTAKTKAGEIADALTKPFRDLWDLLGNIVDKISKIKLPHIPGLGRLAGGRIADDGGGATAAPVQITYQITVNGALDPVAVGAQLTEIMDRYNRSIGVLV